MKAKKIPSPSVRASSRGHQKRYVGKFIKNKMIMVMSNAGEKRIATATRCLNRNMTPKIYHKIHILPLTVKRGGMEINTVTVKNRISD